MPELCGVQVGTFVEFRCKAQIAESLKTEEGVVEVDHRPWSRYDASLCKHRDTFYLFGGTVVQDGRKSNSVYCLSVNTMEWRLIATKDSPWRLMAALTRRRLSEALTF